MGRYKKSDPKHQLCQLGTRLTTNYYVKHQLRRYRSMPSSHARAILKLVTEHGCPLQNGNNPSAQIDGYTKKARIILRIPKLKKEASDNGTIAVGEMSAYTRRSVVGKALLNLENGEGLASEFVDVDDFLDLALSLQNNDLLGVDEATAAAQTKEEFMYHAKKSWDIGGMIVDVEFYTEDVIDMLEESKTLFEVFNHFEKKGSFAGMNDTEIRLRKRSLVQLAVAYHKVRDSLVNGDAFFYYHQQKDENGNVYQVPTTWTCVDGKLARNICQGTALQHHGGPNNTSQPIQLGSAYMVGLLSTLVIDIDAGKVAAESGGKGDGSAGVPFPDDSQRFARRIAISSDNASSLNEYRVSVADGGGGRRHHRFIALVGNKLGINPGTDEFVLDYLKEHHAGKSFDDVFGFDESEVNEAKERLRKKWLDKAGCEIEPKCDTDIDHLVGRSAPWMNSVLFAMFASHQLNIKFHYMRLDNNDWCYLFTKIEYRTKSD